ncbi:MAG TPA: hypothetical protein VFE17_10450 [Candidatus Baltobacteraceae bacterium]|jgi:hypothetical protein|nr:hypothetical protein [Candidatus Baltobacteraceae bacterium]
MKRQWWYLVAVAALALTACSGGSLSTGGNVFAPPTPAPGAKIQPASVHLSVTIPAASNAGSGDGRKYISPNTKSISLLLVSVNGQAVTGQNAAIVQTYAGASNCSSGSGGSLTCTATIAGAVGSDVATVTLYSGPNATGSALAAGSMQFQVAATGSSLAITNGTSISIGGVVANLSVAVSPQSFALGHSASLSVTLTATDASGATIVGPAAFTTPVELTTSDTTGSIGFTTGTSQTPSSSLSVTSPATQIQMVYNGSSQLAAGPITVQAQQGSLTAVATAQAGGVSPSGSPSTSPSGTPLPQNATVYVLNQGSNGGTNATVTEYSLTASGNAAPIRTVTLSPSLYAAGMAVDKTGRIYIGYYDSPTFAIDSGNELDVYNAGASGAAHPAARITSEATQSTMLDPGTIYVDKSGRIITLATTNVDGQSGGDSIVTYAPNANGAVPPVHAWNFDYTNGAMYFVYAFQYGGYYTIGLTEDSAGNLFMAATLGVLASSDRPQGVFVAPASFVNGPPLTQPLRVIPGGGSATTLPAYASGQLLQGLALDSSGTIYVSQAVNGTGSIAAFHSGASGGVTNVPPLRTISGSVLNVSVPAVQVPPQLPLAVAGGTLIVGNQTTNSVLFYPTTASGSATPVTISGTATGLQTPIGVAVGPGQ